MSFTVNPTYLAPLKSDGTQETEDGGETAWDTGRGVFTLEANTTYYFMLPVGGSTLFDVHLTHDDAIAITTATVETCTHWRADVSDYSAVSGEWMDQDPSTAFVATAGAGTTALSGVVTVVAGYLGGADWQVSDCASPRARLAVAVGATGGQVRLSFCGKD